MFDVSSFLLRWMFLSNLCRDVADIQTLPMQPYLQHPTPPQHQPHRPQHEEALWKEHCLRGILSYPPGTQRTLVMDALRTELVQQLAHKLQLDQAVMKQHALANERHHHHHNNNKQQERYHLGDFNGEVDDDDSSEDSDPYLDADLQIVRAFERDEDPTISTSTGRQNQSTNLRDKENLGVTTETVETEKQASLVIDEHGPSVVETRSSGGAKDDDAFRDSYPPPHQQSTIHHHNNKDHQPSEAPSLTDVREASRSLQLTRDYLPQLVAAVLKSPPAFDPQVVNPIQKLRSLILSRCLDDPGAGIELCWLLEAEVGRAWKTLFEHRQQTGRRLIVVLPAEKAAVLAKIGTEKREAFDLLQDAEQATAFGYTSSPASSDHNHQHPFQHENDPLGDEHHHTRLPSSLSLRRCSHFGDTMHFIDRLTKISSDLRLVPDQQRNAMLQDSLYELNRRIRRRMVTRGDVSLDVEDQRSPYDWPQVNDMSVDVIQHSVHLPLVPQIGKWPNGETTTPSSKSSMSNPNAGPEHSSSTSSDHDIPCHDVVRVLNIVVPETRILSSRERCPFLIHVEVADTRLEAGNARLYASGVSGLGSTVSEALAMNSAAGASSAAASSRNWNGARPFGIPAELLRERRKQHQAEQKQQQQLTEGVQSSEMRPESPITVASDNARGHAGFDSNEKGTITFPRGGSNADGNFFDDNGYSYDPFDAVRQQAFEQLHHDLHAQRTMVAPPPSQPQLHVPHPKIPLGLDLLDKIFGREWSEKCKEIRDASPYGHVKGWRLASFILKSGEDIRREAFVMQIITKLQQWFQEIPEVHRPILRPYTIMCVGADAGLVECLSDAKSIDEVKKQTDGFESLRDYFERAYGPPRPKQHPNIPGTAHAPFHQHQQSADMNHGAISFEQAQDNFLRSLVGYSLVCYILQVKDRHNANILIDRFARVIHIDYGYVLGDTPKMGKVPIFSERAPFKLSSEFWDVLGGWNFNAGGLGVQFCKMFEIAFACASSHAEEIATLAEGAMLSLDYNPRSARIVANGIRSRLRMRGPPGSRAQKMFIMDLVNAALLSFGTSAYDWLQRSMNGYQ